MYTTQNPSKGPHMNNLAAPATTPTSVRSVIAREVAYTLLRDGVDLYMGRTHGDDCSATLTQMQLDDESSETLRVDVLDTTLRFFHDLLTEAPQCCGLETAELCLTVQEFICDCYGTPRNINQIIRFGRRGTPYQHEQFLHQPSQWLPIAVMATAAVLMHTSDPYAAIATLRGTEG
jgi:hypothetical protein